MRKFRATIILLILSTLLVVAALVHLGGVGASAGLLPPCLVLGAPFHHRYQPGCEGPFAVGDGRVVHYRINSAGLREPEEPAPGADLVVGDSDVEGHGLEAEETLPARLGAKLGRHFVNGGIRFSGPLYQRVQILRLLPLYRPRSLLWIFCENDVNDDRLFEALTTKRDAAGLPAEFSTDDFRGTDFRLPAFLRFGVTEGVERAVRNALYVRQTERLVASVPPEATHSCAAIDDTLRVLGENKVRVTLAYLPLGPNRPFSADRYYADNLLRCLRDRPNFVSFEEAMRDRGDLFFAHDTHLNPAGVSFVVDRLAPLFRSAR